MEFKVSHESELKEVAKELISFCGDERVVLFNGEMGAGKTTFIKEICNYLEVEDVTSSPTFGIVNEYFSPKVDAIYHFDMYRLEEEEEAYDIGVDEMLYSGNFCFIEWAEKIENLLPLNYVGVNILLEDQTRIITLTKQ